MNYVDSKVACLHYYSKKELDGYKLVTDTYFSFAVLLNMIAIT